MQFTSATSLVKTRLSRSAERDKREIEIILPLLMRKANAERIQNLCALPQAAKQCIIGAERYNAGTPGRYRRNCR